MFRSVIHFELIFVKCVRFESRFTFPAYGCPVVQAPLFEACLFSIVLPLLVKYLCGFVSGCYILFH